MNPQNHNFILKENGLIYLVKDMPGEFTQLIPTDYATVRDFNQAMNANKNAYQCALQSAIDNAVEVSNQEETLKRLIDPKGMSSIADWGKWAKENPNKVNFNHVYSLLCSVEKIRGSRQQGGNLMKVEYALVTFPESGEKKEQEETQPIPMKAGDPRVIVNGKPLSVDFRIISETLYQKLTRK
jgi:hypothetical protein